MTLQLLDDSELQRVLCVAAHPDDLEYGASAAVARWTDAGVDVGYLLLTTGEAGMQAPPDEIGPLRAQEQRAACTAVGVSDLTILSHPDGMLEPNLLLRKDISRRIRQFKPDAVLVPSWELEVPWGLNHVDHRVCGISTVDAVRDADNTWVFPQLAQDEGLAKWHTRRLLVFGHREPTHAVDVSGQPLERAVESLAAHREYLEALGDHPEPRAMLEQFTAGVGEQVGVANAVAFRVYDM